MCAIEVMDFDKYLLKQNNILRLSSQSSIFQHQLHHIDAVQNSQVLSFLVACKCFVQ